MIIPMVHHHSSPLVRKCRTFTYIIMLVNQLSGSNIGLDWLPNLQRLTQFNLHNLSIQPILTVLKYWMDWQLDVVRAFGEGVYVRYKR